MKNHLSHITVLTFIFIASSSEIIAIERSLVPQWAISKCIIYAKSKGMSVNSSSTGNYIDYPNEFWIRVFGSKEKSKNVAATCKWTQKFGGKLTYEDELDYMDH